MEKVVKPIINDQMISPAGSAGGPNTIPPHLQPPAPNVRGVKTAENTEQDQLQPLEVNVSEDDEQGLAGPVDNYRTSPLFYEVANYFGVEEKDFGMANEKLAVITDWAIREGGSTKFEDILLTIRRLENELQPPAWDEKRYNNIYKYLRLANKAQAFQKAMSAFRRDGGKGLRNGK